MAKRRMLPAIRGDRSLLPCIHVDDAARATVAALEHGPAGRSYDIVDDEPVNIKVVRKYLQIAGYKEFITTSNATTEANSSPPPIAHRIAPEATTG